MHKIKEDIVEFKIKLKRATTFLVCPTNKLEELLEE